MFCHNCGNKLEDDAIVCNKCNMVIGRNNYRMNKREKSTNTRGIISFILGIISVLMCFNFMLKDISEVGMYTNIMERLIYAFNIVLVPLFISFITLIISYGGLDKDRSINKVGLFLSAISLFMATFEIVIVIIY